MKISAASLSITEEIILSDQAEVVARQNPLCIVEKVLGATFLLEEPTCLKEAAFAKMHLIAFSVMLRAILYRN